MANFFDSSDNVDGRTFETGVNVDGNFTIETCTAACFNAGYVLAGAEYSTQVSGRLQ
jgi:hypothetical protein